MNRPLYLGLLLGLLSCEDTRWNGWQVEGGQLYDDRYANVVRGFSFLAEDDGAVAGFNLDGEDTSKADSPCGHGDIPGLDGSPGVDNQFGRMWGSIQGLVGEPVQELLQGSINEGRFLMMMEFEGLDDFTTDDSFTFRLLQANGQPVIGTQDLIAPDQTFYLDPEVPASIAEDVQLRDGVFEAGPIDFVLPIDILEERFPIYVVDGRVRGTLDEAGRLTGWIGGHIDVDATMAYLLNSNASAEAQLVDPIFRANQDVVGPNGECSYISTAFGFEGTHAFLVHPSEGSTSSD